MLRAGDNIVWLDLAVDYPQVVDGLESDYDGEDDFLGGGPGHWLTEVPLDEGVKADTFNKFEDQKQVLLGFVDLD